MTNELFNRSVVAAHHARAQKNPVDFLWKKIAAALQDRLLDIKRDFDTGVEIGHAPYVLSPDFLQRKKIVSSCFLSTLGGYGDAVIDEEFLPLRPQSLDLLVSTSTLHWINDLPGTLVQMRRALKPDGVLVAAMFGGETLTELRDVLAQTELALYGGVSPRVSPFATLPDMAALMQRAEFALPVADSEKLTVTYENIYALIADIRGMGQSNAISRRNAKTLSKNFWIEADRDYRACYGLVNGRLPVTVEIIYVIGWSPDPSQQQPLKRGSATHRLADILRTDEIGLEEFT